MTNLNKEEMEELEKECPMDNVEFDPEEVDGKGQDVSKEVESDENVEVSQEVEDTEEVEKEDE